MAEASSRRGPLVYGLAALSVALGAALVMARLEIAELRRGQALTGALRGDADDGAAPATASARAPGADHDGDRDRPIGDPEAAAGAEAEAGADAAVASGADAFAAREGPAATREPSEHEAPVGAPKGPTTHPPAGFAALPPASAPVADEDGDGHGAWSALAAAFRERGTLGDGEPIPDVATLIEKVRAGAHAGEIPGDLMALLATSGHPSAADALVALLADPAVDDGGVLARIAEAAAILGDPRFGPAAVARLGASFAGGETSWTVLGPLATMAARHGGDAGLRSLGLALAPTNGKVNGRLLREVWDALPASPDPGALSLAEQCLRGPTVMLSDGDADEAVALIARHGGAAVRMLWGVAADPSVALQARQLATAALAQRCGPGDALAVCEIATDAAAGRLFIEAAGQLSRRDDGGPDDSSWGAIRERVLDLVARPGPAWRSACYAIEYGQRFHSSDVVSRLAGLLTARTEEEWQSVIGVTLKAATRGARRQG